MRSDANLTKEIIDMFSPSPNRSESIFNWARDFIQCEQKTKGYCSESRFKEMFPYFAKFYKFKGTYKDVLRELKKNGFINRITKEIEWINV